MAQLPHLVEDRGELKLNASINGTRRDLVLSDRGKSLLVDDLEYEKADVVPFTVVKALVLGGGASIPEGQDARDAAWGLSGADGGRDATAEDCYRTAEYLRFRYPSVRSDRLDDASGEPIRRNVRGIPPGREGLGCLRPNPDREHTS